MDRASPTIKWPQEKPPAVIFGRAGATNADYDAMKHVVTLDPWKLTTWTECLDALTFECQNALQRPEMKTALRAGGGAVASVEYESDKMYIEALKRVNKAKDIDHLVEILEIPEDFLKQADYEKCAKAGRVERPSRIDLPEQEKRQALWWYVTQHWNDEQRMQVWIAEAHGEGVVSSELLYG